MADIVAKAATNKWIWIVGGIILLIIVVVGLTSASGSDGGGNGGGTPGPGYNPPYNPPTGPPVVPPTDPRQVLKTTYCETKRVCEGRVGFANWVKTGDKDDCNRGGWRCYKDCLGTCYAWEM